MSINGARSVARFALLLMAMLVLSGHTPYRQWEVYRMKYLLIGTSREDTTSYPVGKQVAELLAQAVPESRARVTRARTLERLGSLFSTDQLRLLLLSENYVGELAQGTGPFAAFGPVEVMRLYRFGGLVLVSNAEFPARHAWILTNAFLDNAEALAGEPPRLEGGQVPIHPGVLAALNGEPSPGDEVAVRDDTP